MGRWCVALACVISLGCGVLGCGDGKRAPFSGAESGSGSRSTNDEDAEDPDDRDDADRDEDDGMDPSEPGASDHEGGNQPVALSPDAAPTPDDDGDEQDEQDESGAEAVVRMLDPEGDAEPLDGMLRYPLDLLELEVETTDDELIARFRFARTLEEHFAFPGVDGLRTAGAPAELYLDLDDDPSTGIVPSRASESEHAAELSGYELVLHVVLNYNFRDKQSGAVGYAGADVILDEDDVEITGHFAEYWFWDQTEDGTLGPSDASSAFPETRDLTEIDGDTIVLHVPLDWLGVGAGDVVGLMYREKDQRGASGVGYSQNARLLVR